VEKTNHEYGETINPENHFFLTKKVVHCLLQIEPRIANPRWPPAQQASAFEVSAGARTHMHPRLDADELLRRQKLQTWMTVALSAILASRLLNFIFSHGAII
jgi:hypothetical protein